MRETEGANPAAGGKTLRIAGLIVLILLAAAAIVYFTLGMLGPKPVPIGEVLGDLRRYDRQVVTVRGRVSNPLNIMIARTYEVSDESGTIKVVTERGLPQDGAEVDVTGVVHEVFSIAGMNMTVILEPAEERD